MYFETGQGSALSADAHEGADQMTLEARNYGLARHYRPFLVNTVVGFIGPEYLYDARQITRAGLEDHFMGKLHGIPMGCDACYTNHADADQNDVENLEVLLATAGCNFFMGLPDGRRHHAQLPVDVVPRQRDAAAAARFAPGARVRGLAGGDGHHARRQADRARRRPEPVRLTMKDAPKPKPTIDRRRVEAMVREALAREVGAETRGGARSRERRARC